MVLPFFNTNLPNKTRPRQKNMRHGVNAHTRAQLSSFEELIKMKLAHHAKRVGTGPEEPQQSSSRRVQQDELVRRVQTPDNVIRSRISSNRHNEGKSDVHLKCGMESYLTKHHRPQHITPRNMMEKRCAPQMRHDILRHTTEHSTSRHVKPS